VLGVISCPKCKNVCGIDLKQKSKKCIKCNYNIKIKKVKIWVKTIERSNLPELIKKVKEKIENPSPNIRDY
jgi:acetyl-CoA carboxylase beta subunit